MTSQSVQIPYAPTVYPTVEEFQDPVRFIAGLSTKYGRYGIVRVVPPSAWKSKFVCNARDFVFRPRVQKIHELNAMYRVRLVFEQRLANFLRLKGYAYETPTIGNLTLNMYKLFQEVRMKGGFMKCTGNGEWPSICKSLAIPDQRAVRLQTIYKDYLLAYERYVNGDGDEAEQKYNGQEPHMVKRRRRLLCADQIEKILCSVCNFGGNEAAMLLCDRCNRGCHINCLIPPLSAVPAGDWHCDKCTHELLAKSPSKPFGFTNCKTEYSFETFGKMADAFEQNQLRNNKKLYDLDEKENQFWQTVADNRRRVTVSYGSDLSTLTFPYGFPSKGMISDETGCANSPWNLKNLPLLPDSALSFIGTPVSGVNVPWLYVGMLYSAFCWHTEDHWSYSVSYLHTGAPKTWYGVPGDNAEAFERLLKRLAPDLFEMQPDLMHQLVTLVDPKILVANNIPVFKLRQMAGDFIITFPRSYHAGFNNGFNCAEAVNVCPADWIPFGRKCMLTYASLRRLCVFSHEEIVFKMVMQKEKMTQEMLGEALKDVHHSLDAEKQIRACVRDADKAERAIFEQIDDDSRQCVVCCTTVFLSCLECACAEKNLVCLKDVDRIPCSCTVNACTFKYRFTLDEMESLAEDLGNSLQAKQVEATI